MEDLKGVVIIISLLIGIMLVFLWATIWRKLDKIPMISFGIATFISFIILCVIFFNLISMPTSRISTANISRGLSTELFIVSLIMILCAIGSIYTLLTYSKKKNGEKHTLDIDQDNMIS